MTENIIPFPVTLERDYYGEVTREAAERVVRQYLDMSEDGGNWEIGSVRTFDEVGRSGIRTPRIRPYLKDDGVDWTDYWVAHLHNPEWWGILCSSTIITVNKRTGKIGYHGSANDEG